MLLITGADLFGSLYLLKPRRGYFILCPLGDHSLRINQVIFRNLEVGGFLWHNVALTSKELNRCYVLIWYPVGSRSVLQWVCLSDAKTKVKC